MAHLTARVSFSMVEYFCSAGWSLQLMYMIGCFSPPAIWVRMALSLEFDASVCTINGCMKSGQLTSTGGMMRACCRSSKALCAAWSQFREYGCFFSRWPIKGDALMAKFCIKQLQYPTRPRNRLSCFLVCGWSAPEMASTFFFWGLQAPLSYHVPQIF